MSPHYIGRGGVVKDPLNEVGASLRSFTEVNRKGRIRLTFTVFCQIISI